jgi:hypothetical protein
LYNISLQVRGKENSPTGDETDGDDDEDGNCSGKSDAHDLRN